MEPLLLKLKKEDDTSIPVCPYCFVLVAIETFGALGETAIDFLRDLGRRIAKVTGERRAAEFLLQRISCDIQRGNAACVLATAADNDSDNLDDIFYL